MKDLIGKQFKRNVYGLSSWTDTVKDVHFVRELKDAGNYFTPKLYVKGSIHNYPISEIVFISKNAPK